MQPAVAPRCVALRGGVAAPRRVRAPAAFAAAAPARRLAAISTRFATGARLSAPAARGLGAAWRAAVTPRVCTAHARLCSGGAGLTCAAPPQASAAAKEAPVVVTTPAMGIVVTMTKLPKSRRKLQARGQRHARARFIGVTCACPALPRLARSLRLRARRQRQYASARTAPACARQRRPGGGAHATQPSPGKPYLKSPRPP